MTLLSMWILESRMCNTAWSLTLLAATPLTTSSRDPKGRRSFLLWQISKAVETAAQTCSHSTRGGREPQISLAPLERRAACKRRRAFLPSTEERQISNNLVNMLRRKWKSKSALNKNKEVKVQTRVDSLHCRMSGAEETSREMWAEMVTAHVDSTFFDNKLPDNHVTEMVRELRAEQHYSEQFGIVAPQMCIDTLLEIIKFIPTVLMYVLLALFIGRFCGGTSEDIGSWQLIILNFIEKVSRPSCIQSFRGVFLLDVLGKTYMAALISLGRATSLPFGLQHVCLFAYHLTVSTNDLSGSQTIYGQGI